MRDIDDYSKEYDKADFEEYEVKFRRKKILKVISQNGLRNILEIDVRDNDETMRKIIIYIEDIERDKIIYYKI